jgi:SEC-C motif
MGGGQKKIGRNDPCPCGSGKKYKNCCYPDRTRVWETAGSHEGPAFKVKPAAKPEPITQHLISPDGGKTWTHRPGVFEVQISGKDVKDIDESIRKIIEPVWRDLFHDVEHDLLERILNLEHKLYAVKYHLNNYGKAERDKIEEFTENYNPPTGAQQIIEEPRLIYEVEAFLFQVKSCLDILSWVLKPAFGFAYCSFGDNGDDVIKQLKNNCPTTLAPFADNIISMIEDAQEAWIVDLITMRDQITHYSNLKGFNCFVQDPYMGGGTASIHYPTMPNQRRALEYCNDIWKRLLSFCEEFLKLAAAAAKSKSSN